MDCPRRLGDRQPHHTKGIQNARERGEERNQQRHLEGAMPRGGVDPDDLVLDLGGLPREKLLELDRKSVV